MATTHQGHNPVPPDTPIAIKIAIGDSLKKLKLPLRDLTADILLDKASYAIVSALPLPLPQAQLCLCLNIDPNHDVVFERFSDSAGGFITLDPNNPQVFKTLVRAAKAKLKLRLKATVTPSVPTPQQEQKPAPITEKSTVQQPVIVQTPVYQPSRESLVSTRSNLGSGIFQFRETRSSQPSLVHDEAPVPSSFMAPQKSFLEELARAGSQRSLPLRSREVPVDAPVQAFGHGHAWSVYCNVCDVAMADAHYHCSICDQGDYDLCEDCVAKGKLCPGDGHWLIKRFIQDGKVINSTTERVSKKVTSPTASGEPKEVRPEMPGTFADDTKAATNDHQLPTRTCNCCVVVLPEREFVTCTICDDFDLCVMCHVKNEHGHHPAHGFEPATKDTVLPLTAKIMLAPGRNASHNAICDGCDKKVFGVRHKCLNCPDWDFCNDCFKNAATVHPRHRFAAIYTPIAEQAPVTVRHYGIFCDGPLCNKNERSYISGVRYKCTVCHDTDFCASCEAMPNNHHNRTHPLIKFKTPVRNVTISTTSQDNNGSLRTLGDQNAVSSTRSQSTETSPVPVANAATQVQTVADFKPTEAAEVPKPIPVIKSEKPIVDNQEHVSATLLNAHFVKDSIPDGLVVRPGARFTQIWTLRNPGPYSWPPGCSVRYVGGDNMLNVDNAHPASVADLAAATESNVVGRMVLPGEEIAFKVTLKAPVREGKSISYWRLKSANGTAFGHRLWCDVEVKKEEEVTSTEANQAVQPEPLNPFNEQMKRQQQSMMQMQRHQQMMVQAHNQAMRSRQLGNPPPYTNSVSSTTDIASRVAAMRQAQQARREAMMATFNSHRDQQTSSDIIKEKTIKREESLPWYQGPIYPMAGMSEQVPGPDAERLRREAAMARTEVLKAKIQKLRDDKAKAAEDLAIKTRIAEEIADGQGYKYTCGTIANMKKLEEMRKVKKIIEEASKAGSVDEAEKLEVENSQMVFPKLEKESPASSTYLQSSASGSQGKGKAAYVENEAGQVERSATPSGANVPDLDQAASSPTKVEKEEYDDLTDLEVLSANGEDSEDDDGFLTDEEYDILDASDRETVASP